MGQKKVPKVQGQWRLPEPLVKRVKIRAIHEGLQVNRMVEILLDRGLKAREQDRVESAAN